MSERTRSSAKIPLPGDNAKTAVLALLCLGGALSAATLNGSLQSDLDRARVAQPKAVSEEGGTRHDPRLFRLLSFGQVPSAVDWVWIQALLDDRISHVPRTSHAAIYYDLELIASLDPAFSEVYISGANLLAVIRDDVYGARDLLLKGESFRKDELPALPAEARESYWQREWMVPVNLAYVQLFELDDLPAAAQAFKDAAAVKGAPGYLPILAKQLSEPGGQYNVAAKLLNLMIAGAREEGSRQGLARKLESLKVAKFMDDLNRGFREFRSRRGGEAGAPTGAELSRYLSEPGGGSADPWGGQLSLGEGGKIVTSTAHDRVMGLD